MASEDVINPFALACLFEDDYILGLFDDANPSFITSLIGANRAHIGFCEIVADFTLFDFGFNVAYGLSKGQGFGGPRLENMKREAFGGLGADARKLAKLLDEFIYGFCIAGCHKILQFINTLAIRIHNVLQKSKLPVKIQARCGFDTTIKLSAGKLTI